VALGKELGKCTAEQNRLKELMMDMKRAWESDLQQEETSCNMALDNVSKDCHDRERESVMFAKAMEQRADQAEQELSQLSAESRCRDVEARSKLMAAELTACELSRANLSASCEDSLERVGQANSSCHESREALQLRCSDLELQIAAVRHEVLTTSQKLEASEVSRSAAQRQLAKAMSVEVDELDKFSEHQNRQPGQSSDEQCESSGRFASDNMRDMPWHAQEMLRLCGSSSRSPLHGVVCPLLAHVHLEGFDEGSVHPQDVSDSSHGSQLLEQVRAALIPVVPFASYKVFLRPLPTLSAAHRWLEGA